MTEQPKRTREELIAECLSIQIEMEGQAILFQAIEDMGAGKKVDMKAVVKQVCPMIGLDPAKYLAQLGDDEDDEAQ